MNKPNFGVSLPHRRDILNQNQEFLKWHELAIRFNFVHFLANMLLIQDKSFQKKRKQKKNNS